MQFCIVIFEDLKKKIPADIRHTGIGLPHPTHQIFWIITCYIITINKRYILDRLTHVAVLNGLDPLIRILCALLIRTLLYDSGMFNTISSLIILITISFCELKLRYHKASDSVGQ